MDENDYLLGLVRYIHHDPLKAGMVISLSEDDWTSHHGYLSDADVREWRYREPVLKEFSNNLNEARKGYRRFMNQDDDERLERVFAKSILPVILGSKEIIRNIKDRFFLTKTSREVPTAKHLAPSSREVIEASAGRLRYG